MSRESHRPAAPPEADNDHELARALAGWEPPHMDGAPDFEALRASLDQQLAEERGWGAYLRSRATPVRVAAAALLLGAVAAATWLLGARVDLAFYPGWRLALGLGVMLACFLISVGVALRPLSRPALGARAFAWAVALAPLLLAGLYLLPAAHTDHPASLQPEGAAAVVLRALPCLIVGALIAVVGLVALRTLDRGGNRARLLLASAGGVAANVVLLLHCSMTAPAHMLLGHLGALLLVIAGVLLAGKARA